MSRPPFDSFACDRLPPAAPLPRCPALAGRLQGFVAQTVVPHKHPRAVALRDALPRMGTGKLQRLCLREGP